MAHPDGTLVNFEQQKSRRFLRDLRDNPFVAIVVYDDGDVSVFSKDVGPEQMARIREAIEGKLSERMELDADT